MGLRPKWFPEVRQGLREMAIRDADRWIAPTITYFEVVKRQMEYAEGSAREQLLKDHVDVEEWSDTLLQLLSLDYSQTFGAEMLRRLEESE